MVFNQQRAQVKNLCGRSEFILIRNNSTIKLRWAVSWLLWIMDDWCRGHKAMLLTVFVPKFTYTQFDYYHSGAKYEVNYRKKISRTGKKKFKEESKVGSIKGLGLAE